MTQTDAPPPNFPRIPTFPELSDVDALLWDSYLNRFCKTYTTITNTSSPFLSCIVPLAIRYEVVRRAVLAMAALQLDLSSRPELYQALKTHRHLAQLTVSKQIESVSRAMDMDQIMSIGTTSVLLLIASKLSGHSYSVVCTHLRNIRHLTAQVSAMAIFPSHDGSFKTKLIGFWKKMLSYTGVLADLVGARHRKPTSLNQGGLQAEELSPMSTQLIQSPRFETLVARINSEPELVSSLDIDMWCGELDFMPSVTTASTTPGDLDFEVSTTVTGEDDVLIREIYRTTLRIQHFKKLRDDTSATNPSIRHTYTTLAYPPFVAQEFISKLARLQIQYIQQLSPCSRYDTSLLLPLGVTGPEVSRQADRDWIIHKLQTLQTKLGFPLLRKCQKELLYKWSSTASTSKSLGNDGSLSDARAPGVLLWG